MTETPQNTPYDPLELATLARREYDTFAEAARQFSLEWQRAAGEARLDPNLVRYTSSPTVLKVEIADFLEIEYDAFLGLRYSSYDPQSNTASEVSRAEAASAAGLSETTLEDAEPHIHRAFRAARSSWEDAASMRQEWNRRAQQSSGSPAETSEDVEWVVTPTQALAVWVQTTTKLETLLDSGNYAAARNVIREADEYLQIFDDGQVAPGDYEVDGYYLQALERAAVPIGSNVPDRVLNDLRSLGATLPDFPDPLEATRLTRVGALKEHHVDQILDQTGISTTSRTPQGRAFINAWDDAMRLLPVALNPVYPGHTDAGVVIERLGRDLDAYVHVMLTFEGDLDSAANGSQPAKPVLSVSNLLGDQVSRGEFAERLGLSDEEAGAVMGAVESGLLAADRSIRGERGFGPTVTQVAEEQLLSAKRVFADHWVAGALAAGLDWDDIETVIFTPSNLDYPLYLGDDVVANERPGEDGLDYTARDMAGESEASRSDVAGLLGVSEARLELMEPLLADALRASAPHRAEAMAARAAELGRVATVDPSVGAQQSASEELAGVQGGVRRVLAGIDAESPDAATYLGRADRALTNAIEELRPLADDELRKAPRPEVLTNPALYGGTVDPQQLTQTLTSILNGTRADPDDSGLSLLERSTGGQAYIWVDDDETPQSHPSLPSLWVEPTGQPTVMGHYLDGQMEGTWSWVDQRGGISAQSQYHQGQPLTPDGGRGSTPASSPAKTDPLEVMQNPQRPGPTGPR